MCDVLILVDQSAEPVVSSDALTAVGVRREGPQGSGLSKSAVRPVRTRSPPMLAQRIFADVHDAEGGA
jgi:hypothetical protein